MTLFKSIKHSQHLVQQLSNSTISEEDVTLLSSLAAELENISISVRQLQDKDFQTSTITPPEIKSGCYVFADQKGFFCPHCYDNDGNKVPTKRMNSKLRVCPTCRASIK